MNDWYKESNWAMAEIQRSQNHPHSGAGLDRRAGMFFGSLSWSYLFSALPPAQQDRAEWELHNLSPSLLLGRVGGLPGSACEVLRVFPPIQYSLSPWVLLSSWYKHYWVSRADCVLCNLFFFPLVSHLTSISFTEFLLIFLLGDSIKDLLFLTCPYFTQLQCILLTHFLRKLNSFYLSSLSSFKSFLVSLSSIFIPPYTHLIALHHSRKHRSPS